MQNELLDIIIIGCLVLLFASTYRKRATPMVRSWTLGWLLILVHFTALLFHPSSPLLANLLTITSLASLVACGIVFLLAANNPEDNTRSQVILVLVAASAAVCFAALDIVGITAPLPYYLVVAVAGTCALVYDFRLPRISPLIRSFLAGSKLVTIGWLLWTISHHQPDVGLSALLAQVFLCVALIYAGHFRRLSAGTVTVVAGLFAWASVFPIAAFCDHLGLIGRISNEVWNVPKYFVAFGMILVLLEEEIIAASHQAHQDQLTGLPNRAWLESKLHKALAHPANPNRQSALLCLDLDRFKQINDTYGHTVGDACLQEVARRLGPHVHNLGTAARIGGEEFSLFLPEISNSAQAEQLASDVLIALQAPIRTHHYTIELTASIGIAVSPADGKDATTLWRNADSAMYRAKRAGGNQYLCMSPEIALLNSEANLMERFVRQSLKTGAFELHYQPLYKITGELHSLEALVRLRHPEQGLISPQRFIAIAEERGLIVPLGNWVLNEICAQSATWQREGLPPVRIDINISPLQITRPDFAMNVLEVLASHDIDPHLIGMEITETAMMRNLAEASRQIEFLAAVGIAFSIDDFGTGYSSLGQLDKLPVQSLKIDRTFVDRICLSGGTYSIVDAIISMAHSLRLNVVAEGVENHEQWASLRHLGCDIIQGYLFSTPLQASQITSHVLQGLRPNQPSIHVA